MNKITNILKLGLIMLIPSYSNAQLLNIRIGSDALVEDAIKDAIVIVESSYCIQDVETNQKYGRNGKSYFNNLQFLGCKTNKGIIVSEKAVTPWSVDNLFNKYRNDSKYRPLLDNTLTVQNQTDSKTDTFNIESDVQFNRDSMLVCFNMGSGNTEGLTLTVNDKAIANWIVWIKGCENKENDEKKGLEYYIVKQTIDLSEGKTVVNTPRPGNTYLGGLYVSAKVLSVGLVEFSLSGLVVDNFGKWIVEPIKDDFILKKEDNQKDIKSPDNNISDDVLTPVKEKKEKKKKKK